LVETGLFSASRLLQSIAVACHHIQINKTTTVPVIRKKVFKKCCKDQYLSLEYHTSDMILPIHTNATLNQNFTDSLTREYIKDHENNKKAEAMQQSSRNSHLPHLTSCRW
jgi:hypothetical protein